MLKESRSTMILIAELTELPTLSVSTETKRTPFRRARAVEEPTSANFLCVWNEPQMMSSNILVVCGTSVATSTVVREKLKEELPQRGVDLGSLTKAKATEAASKVNSGNYDLIVATTSLSEDQFDIPVITTQAFMTGMGEDEVLDEIAEAL